jgi:antitoxin FitA
LLAKRQQRLHGAIVGVQITIRDVPEPVRDELAARAARARQSMQEFLRGELTRLASRPSIEVWLEQVRERKRAGATRVSRAAILRARDVDRR